MTGKAKRCTQRTRQKRKDAERCGNRSRTDEKERGENVPLSLPLSLSSLGFLHLTIDGDTPSQCWPVSSEGLPSSNNVEAGNGSWMAKFQPPLKTLNGVMKLRPIYDAIEFPKVVSV